MSTAPRMHLDPIEDFAEEYADIVEAIERLNRAALSLNSDWLTDRVTELESFRDQFSIIADDGQFIEPCMCGRCNRCISEDEYNGNA